MLSIKMVENTVNITRVSNPTSGVNPTDTTNNTNTQSIAKSESYTADEMTDLRKKQAETEAGARQNFLQNYGNTTTGQLIQAQNQGDAQRVAQLTEKENEPILKLQKEEGAILSTPKPASVTSTTPPAIETKPKEDTSLKAYQKLLKISGGKIENIYSTPEFQTLTPGKQAGVKTIIGRIQANQPLTEDRKNQIVNNLNTYAQTNPALFKNRQTFIDNFGKYDTNGQPRSEAELQTVANWYKSYVNKNPDELFSTMINGGTIDNPDIQNTVNYKIASQRVKSFETYSNYSTEQLSTAMTEGKFTLGSQTAKDMINAGLQDKITAAQQQTQFQNSQKITNNVIDSVVSTDSTKSLSSNMKANNQKLDDVDSGIDTITAKYLQMLNDMAGSISKTSFAEEYKNEIIDNPNINQAKTKINDITTKINDTKTNIEDMKENLVNQIIAAGGQVNTGYAEAMAAQMSKPLIKKYNGLVQELSVAQGNYDTLMSNATALIGYKVQDAQFEQQAFQNKLTLLGMSYTAMNSAQDRKDKLNMYNQQRQDALDKEARDWQKTLQGYAIQKENTLDLYKQQLSYQDLWKNGDINSSNEQLVKKAINNAVNESVSMYTAQGWTDWQRSPAQISASINEGLKSGKYKDLSDGINQEIVKNVQNNPLYKYIVGVRSGTISTGGNYVMNTIKDADGNESVVVFDKDTGRYNIESPYANGIKTNTGTGTSIFQDMTTTLQRPAGSKNVGQDTNNPGNIMAESEAGKAYAKSLGAVGFYKSPNGRTYAVFNSMQDGLNAMQSDLDSKLTGGSSWADKGTTLGDFATGWTQGPKAKYNTNAANAYAKITGYSVNTPIGQIPKDKLMQAITTFEGVDTSKNASVPTTTTGGTEDLNKLGQILIDNQPRGQGFSDADVQQFTKTVQRYMQEGDESGLLSKARDNILEDKNVKNIYLKGSDIRDNIANVKTLLQEYKNSGGNMNIFNGNVEKVMNSIGETSNPLLAQIKSSLGFLTADYIRSISGTAASDNERGFLQSLLPSITNVTSVNDALLNSFDNRLRQQMKTYINKGASSIYKPYIDKIFGDELGTGTTTTSTQPTTTTAQYGLGIDLNNITPITSDFNLFN